MARTPVKVAVIVYAVGPDTGLRYLVLQTNERRGRFWQPVTGGVETGETPAETAVRETEEETGLMVVGEVLRLDHAHTFPIPAERRHRYPPGCEVIQEHGFAARVPLAEPVLDPEEHEAFRWVEYAQAVALMYWAPNRQALECAHTLLRRQWSRQESMDAGHAPA